MNKNINSYYMVLISWNSLTKIFFPCFTTLIEYSILYKLKPPYSGTNVLSGKAAHTLHAWSRCGYSYPQLPETSTTTYSETSHQLLTGQPHPGLLRQDEWLGPEVGLLRKKDVTSIVAQFSPERTRNPGPLATTCTNSRTRFVCHKTSSCPQQHGRKQCSHWHALWSSH